jgi:hypothetical protein
MRGWIPGRLWVRDLEQDNLLDIKVVGRADDGNGLAVFPGNGPANSARVVASGRLVLAMVNYAGDTLSVLLADRAPSKHSQRRKR